MFLIKSILNNKLPITIFIVLKYSKDLKHLAKDLNQFKDLI